MGETLGLPAAFRRESPAKDPSQIESEMERQVREGRARRGAAAPSTPARGTAMPAPRTRPTPPPPPQQRPLVGTPRAALNEDEELPSPSPKRPDAATMGREITAVNERLLKANLGHASTDEERFCVVWTTSANPAEAFNRCNALGMNFATIAAMRQRATDLRSKYGIPLKKFTKAPKIDLAMKTRLKDIVTKLGGSSAKAQP